MPISLIWTVPWSCMELGVRQFQWQHFGHWNTNIIRSSHRVIFPLYYIRNKMEWTDMSKLWYSLGYVNSTYFLNKCVYNQLRLHINWLRIMNKGKIASFQSYLLENVIMLSHSAPLIYVWLSYQGFPDTITNEHDKFSNVPPTLSLHLVSSFIPMFHEQT